MISSVIKETFSLKFWKGFSSTVGGSFVFFFVGKTAGMNLLGSILLGVGFFILVFALRFCYVYGKQAQDAVDIIIIDGLTKTIEKIRVDNEQEIAEIRKAKNVYGEAILELNQGFGAIHWFRSLTNINKDDFLDVLEIMCGQLKILFDRKTGAECAVSIKIPYKSGAMTAQTRVINIIRDRDSIGRDTPLYRKKQHTIFANTCFNVICDNLTYTNRNHYYINNNIPASSDYRNSSSELHKGENLPYASEIVVPILPNKYTDGEERNLALGFLCVDSAGTNVFDERYDIGLLQGVAEGIYDVIKQRNTYIQAKSFVQTGNSSSNSVLSKLRGNQNKTSNRRHK